MDGRKKDKYGSPIPTSPESLLQDLFAGAEQRRRQIAERIGVGNVVLLGMNIDGVTYQGVLLPLRECKIKKT